MTILEVQTSRAKWTACLVLALGFVALGLGLALTGRAVLVGWLNVLFFGWCATMFARQLTNPRPRILIDDSGITDNTLRVGRIEWADILGTELRYIRRHPFLSLELRDPSKYTARLSPTMRRLVQANMALGFTELNVNLAGITADPHEVAAAVEAERRRRTLAAAT